MNRGDLATVFVAYTNSKNGKRRPIFVIQDQEKVISFFSITTKYENKSEAIRNHYLEILDWELAGLRKKSWIDTITVYELPKNNENITWKPIGFLSERDLERLDRYLDTK